jgi:hypothetical protein
MARCRLLAIALTAAALVAAAPAGAFTITRFGAHNGATAKEVGRRCGVSKLGVYHWKAVGHRSGKTFILEWDEYVIKADGRFRNLHMTFVGGTVYSTLPNRTRRQTIANVFSATDATQVALLKNGKQLRYRHPGVKDHTVPFAPRAGC